MLRQLISKLVKKLPSTEKYPLSSQPVRSSRSITTNIAEGYGRFTYKETRNFFVIARGSVTEVLEHLTIALDEEYFTAEEVQMGEDQCTSVFKLISGYISYLDNVNKKKLNS